MSQRACPACTLLTEDVTRTACELCGCELDDPPPTPKRRRSIESFFNKPQANASPPAAPPAAPLSAPPTPTPPPARLDAAHANSLAATEPSPPAATSATTAAATAADAADASADASALTLPLAQYAPHRACWRRPGAAVPYAHLAATLDALEATRSRLAKALPLLVH